MVQSMKNGNFYPEPETGKQTVKMETDDYLDHQFEPDYKRPRTTLEYHQAQWGMAGNSNMYPVVPHQLYNSFEEQCPLGLKLKKTPELVGLIQSHLSITGVKNENFDCKDKSSDGVNDKLKASNIPGLLLRIGRWEYMSKNEGDLVGKFYFAKHKVVWEVLEEKLKSKIEIAWSDITALKADCPEIGESYLKLVLARQPLFYREVNPQPRKHTIWQPCADFTEGEASLNRIHILKVPQGMLQKHYEKLIKSDNHLNILNWQPDVVVDLPYFESGVSSVPTATRSNYFNNELVHGGKMLEQPRLESFSPGSVMSIDPFEEFMNQSVEFQGAGKVSTSQSTEPAGLHTSMSKQDILNCLDTIVPPVETADRKAQLEQYYNDFLLNDNDSITDEKLLMERVNSLGCLIEKDSAERSINLKENQCDTFTNPSIPGANINKENSHNGIFNTKPSVFESISGKVGEESEENPSMKSPNCMNFAHDSQSHFN